MSTLCILIYFFPESHAEHYNFYHYTVVQKNTPLTTRPIAIIPREDSTHKYPCINLQEVYGLVQKYLDPENTEPLSNFFSRGKQCYVLSCDDELERVDIRVHLFRSDENCHNLLVFYRSIGID